MRDRREYVAMILDANSDENDAMLVGIVELEITTSLEDAAEIAPDCYAEIVTAYVDPWTSPGCP